MSKPRLIAFYLPQFYPTQENDKWWGKGFTEWTNVGKAKPLYKGHYQPKVPADLGYYDLRLPEVRVQQANMARKAGIEGFCYWHYWTNGKRLLDRVFKEVLRDQSPDFPFCLCWANHSWYKKTWDDKGKDILLVEQLYPGKEDYIRHFNAMLPAFKDPRYMRENGKLLFGVFQPNDIPNTKEFFETWNKLAKDNELVGFHFFAYSNQRSKNETYLNLGYDSVVSNIDWEYMFQKGILVRALSKFFRNYLKIPKLIPYKSYVDICNKTFDSNPKILPCIEPNFDHSPRSGSKGLIFKDSNPKLWEKLCENTFKVRSKLPHDKNIIFIKAWNEWGEGNYLEPDLKYGTQYLDSIYKALSSMSE